MNSKAFVDLIEDAKLWLDQEFADQKEVIARDYLITPQKALPKKTAKLDPLIPTEDLSSIEVFLISTTTDSAEKALAERLTSAIDERIAKAKFLDGNILEKNNLWSELFSASKKLRHILISEMEFYQLASFMKHYKKSPVRSVFNVPLFLLADLKCYNQDVELKKSLWASLLSEL